MPPLRSLHRWSLVALGVLAMALSFLERQTLSVLAPTVCKDLGLSNVEYGWTGSVFALSLLVATPLAGAFLDRAGVRRGLLAATLAWSFASAAHGLAAGLGSLIVLRALLGVAESPAFPGSAQVVRSVLPPSRVGRGLGFVLAGSTAGALAALFVAVEFQQRFGWRGAFLGVAVISAAWVPLWAAISSAGAAPAHLDVPREAAGPSARAAFAHPAVLRAVLFTLGVSPMLAFANLWWAKFLVARHGIAQADVAWYGFLLPVAYDAGAIMLGDLAGRARRSSGEGVMLAACCLALAVGLIPLAGTPWFAVAAAAVAFFGVGGAFSISTAGALVAVDHAAVSRAGAMVATANSLGFVVFNPLIGWSIDRTGSYTPALVAFAFLAVPGAAAWFLLGRRASAPAALAPSR